MSQNEKEEYTDGFTGIYIRAFLVFSIFIFIAAALFFVSELNEPKIEIEPILPFSSPPNSAIENADYTVETDYIPADFLPLEESDFNSVPPDFEDSNKPE